MGPSSDSPRRATAADDGRRGDGGASTGRTGGSGAPFHRLCDTAGLLVLSAGGLCACDMPLSVTPIARPRSNARARSSERKGGRRTGERRRVVGRSRSCSWSRRPLAECICGPFAEGHTWKAPPSLVMSLCLWWWCGRPPDTPGSAAAVGSRMTDIKRLAPRSPVVRRCSSRRPDAPRARPRRAGHRGPSPGPTRPRAGRQRPWGTNSHHSHNHPRGCCKRQSAFATTSPVANRKRIKRSFRENPSRPWQNLACLLFGESNVQILTATTDNCLMLMWRDKTAKTPHFPRKQTVHRRALQVRCGSSSLDLGLSGIDRGAGWASRSTAGARRADLTTFGCITTLFIISSIMN